MKSEGFWILIPKQRLYNIDNTGTQVKSFSNLNAAIENAELDEELFLLMYNKKYNTILLRFKLEQYFYETKDRFKYSKLNNKNYLLTACTK